MTRPPKPSAKAQVLKVYPNAKLHESDFTQWFSIHEKDLPARLLGEGSTRNKAWANAATNLKGKR